MMKFGANLGILEPVTCGPDNMARNALWYWKDMYKWLSAAGFPGFESVYKPWDFNLGRSGMPYTKASMDAFFDGPANFRSYLKETGLTDYPAISISAGDVVADYQVRGLDDTKWLQGLEEFANEAIDSAAELNVEGIIIYPTPDYAYLIQNEMIDGTDSEKKLLTEVAEALNRIVKVAGKKGIKIAVRNTYWSLVRNEKIDYLFDLLDKDILFSPDAASFFISQDDIHGRIEKYKDRIGFVLLNDTFFEDKHEIYKQPLPEYPQIGASRVYCMVGKGKVDAAGIISDLKHFGYDGWVICGSHDATNVPKAILDLSWYIDHVLKAI